MACHFLVISDGHLTKQLSNSLLDGITRAVAHLADEELRSVDSDFLDTLVSPFCGICGFGAPPSSVAWVR